MKKILKKSLAVILSVVMVLLSFAMTVSAAEASVIDESKLSEYHVISEKSYKLIGGVTETEIILNKSNIDYQNVIYVMEIPADNNDVTIVTGYNDGDADGWGMKTVTQQAHALEEARGIEVIGSVNGSYYNTSSGIPVGLFVMENEVVCKANGYPFFGVTKDGEYVIRSGDGETSDLVSAVSGSPVLVNNGQVTTGATGTLAPRTAVGIKADGSAILCVNDGRQDPRSYGFDLDEMAEIMYALGCVKALNLDGGGSSTFITQREGTTDVSVKNTPSRAGNERNVAVTLHVVTTAEKTGVFDHITFNEPVYDVNVNKTVNIDVYAVDENGYRTEFPEGGKLELADSTLGTLKGTKFTSGSETGRVTVNYVLDGEVLASTEINIYKESALAGIFKEIMNFFNMIRIAFERIIEELNERVFSKF